MSISIPRPNEMLLFRPTTVSTPTSSTLMTLATLRGKTSTREGDSRDSRYSIHFKFVFQRSLIVFLSQEDPAVPMLNRRGDDVAEEELYYADPADLWGQVRR